MNWVDLYEQVSRHRDDLQYAHTEVILSILAGEGATLWGQPVEIQMTWPSGLPLRFKTEAELRDWAATELAQVRARRSALHQQDSLQVGRSNNGPRAVRWLPSKAGT